MKKEKKICEIVAFVLSAGLTLGVKLLFHACAEGENGWMSCHWAEQAVFGLGLVLTVQSVLLYLGKERRVRQGLALGMLPAAALSFFLPGFLIRLCMMDTMRCHTVLAPSVRILSALLLADLIVLLLRERKEAA